MASSKTQDLPKTPSAPTGVETVSLTSLISKSRSLVSKLNLKRHLEPETFGDGEMLQILLDGSYCQNISTISSAWLSHTKATSQHFFGKTISYWNANLSETLETHSWKFHQPFAPLGQLPSAGTPERLQGSFYWHSPESGPRKSETSTSRLRSMMVPSSASQEKIKRSETIPLTPKQSFLVGGKNS